jgi:predicted acylesterase/phospholipase RssA
MDYRIFYFAQSIVVERIKQELSEFKAQVVSECGYEAYQLGELLAQKLSEGNTYFQDVFSSEILNQNFGAEIFFFSDAIEMSQALTKLDADLMYVDERIENASEAPIEFEMARNAMDRFLPRGVVFASRRIIVVTSTIRKERGFELGVANVKRVIVEPNSTILILQIGLQALVEFQKNQNKTSLCISGGGIDGYIYSLGVTRALDEVFLKRSCNDFNIYAGVSSGSLLGSSLAIGLKVSNLVKQIYRKDENLEDMSLKIVFDPAISATLKRTSFLVKALTKFDAGEIITGLKSLVPVGFFQGVALRKFIERQIETAGVPDELSAVPKELYISVTDQDSVENVVFGEEPWRDIKLSQAIRASTALPPFFLPEKIKGHWFTDGQLTSSSDFKIAIKKGAKLVVLVDPMVAYKSSESGGVMKYGGYFTVVQAIKSLVETRSQSMLRHAIDNHPDVDFIVFQPTDKIMTAMAGSPMSYRLRTEVQEMAYEHTLERFSNEYDFLSRRLEKHGFKLKPKSEIDKALASVQK